MRAWLHPFLSRPSGSPSGYRQLIAPLPIPTVEQTESFAAYVVGAHSWYKHLPHDPPGVPFVVFLDPNAGRQRVLAADGVAEYRDCVDGQEPFHYTWMYTDEYRTKFGHWEYANDFNHVQGSPSALPKSLPRTARRSPSHPRWSPPGLST